MADISKITLPSGSVYDIKDATARAAIANLQNTENVLSTDAASTPYGVQWISGSTTITGTLVASSTTIKKIYLVPNDGSEEGNTYDEYLTLKINNQYSWEKIGTTKVDLSGLGALAYKNSASGSYTPAGTISKPSFTGSSSTVDITATNNNSGNYQPQGTVSTPSFSGDEMTSTGTFTPSGSVSVTAKVDSQKVYIISATTGAASYTPAGQVSQPTFEGNSTQSTGTFTPSGSISFTNTNKTATVSKTSGTATYTPEGSVTAPTISVKTAGSTTTVNSITAVGTLPSLTTTVENENLTIGFSAGTLPTKGSNTTVKTGDAVYEASAPSFSGTGARLVTANISIPSSATFSGSAGNITVTGTPSGTVSQPSFSGTGARLVTAPIPLPDSYTATFSGAEGNISVLGTPIGSISQPTFTGTKVQLSGTTTASGSVSQPSFSGTTATITVT